MRNVLIPGVTQTDDGDWRPSFVMDGENKHFVNICMNAVVQKKGQNIKKTTLNVIWKLFEMREIVI